MSETATPARRRSGRRGASSTGAAPRLAQQPKGQARLRFEPTRFISDDELEAIHLVSLEVLQDIGIDMMLPEARELFTRAGASVDGERVRIPSDVIEHAISTAPASYDFHARNPANTIRIGDGYLAFGTVGSAPNASDFNHGRRPGNLEDYRGFLKLAQSFNCIDFVSGYPVEPIDVHASIRHLVALKDMATLTDKPFHAYSLGPERIRDGIEIARIARGIPREQFEHRAIAVHHHQHQLAAEDGPAHAAGHHGDVGGWPDRLRDAVHAGRCHGPGHGGRCAGSAERRGVGRHRA
jgi:trimethylamine--corrinoid protein Co-methyltransferase